MKKKRIYSLFGVYHAQLGDATVTLGLRHDEHETSSVIILAGLLAVFLTLANRFIMGESWHWVRAPSLYELYGRDAIFMAMVI